jgi:molybdopterin-binding protein
MMETRRQLLTAREASRMLGISYPTIKKWILEGKIKTVRTPGGHHRLSRAGLQPFLQADSARPEPDSRARYRRVSGRNQLVGKVASVRIEGLMAEVVVVVGEIEMIAIITADAAKELRLKKGENVAALVKSTDVMIERLDAEDR